MEELFFELIRVAIGRQECLSRTPNAEEWQALYDMAEKQALLGVCFAGVTHLKGKEDSSLFTLHSSLYYQWLAVAAQIQERNVEMNRQCVEVQDRLSAIGFQTSILKGQGVGSLYADPLCTLRQSGDIDVWVDGGMKKALAYARTAFGNVSFDYINAHLPMLKDTEVEMHWRAQALTNLFKNRKLQRWLDSQTSEMTAGRATFPDGGEIVVPSTAFNRFYILLHCYHHMFESGLGLRQLMDYYFVLRSEEIGEKETADLNALLSEFGMMRFARAVMWLSGHVFNLESRYMVCPPDEKEGLFILKEVMQNGNFGHHDQRMKRISRSRLIQPIVTRLQHNWHLATRYPLEFLWAPVWLVYHYIWKRTNK